MHWRKLSLAKAFALVVCAVFMTPGRAAEALKETPFSTNEPLEVPAMMLDSGRYVFRLSEPAAERNVLQVFEAVQLWTGDGTRLLSTMLTMPNYDLPTPDKTVFSFFERGPKQAKALRLWFAPGRKYGQEFVYPKAQAVELAKSVGRSVLSLPAELPGNIGQLARMVAEPNREAFKAPIAPPIPERRAPDPVNFSPEATTGLHAPPPQRAAPIVQNSAPRENPRAPKAASGEGARAAKTASRDAIASEMPLQSRARARQSKMIAATLPRTASYSYLVAFVGLVGIACGTLLRILALRLGRR
jgi:hypothetical protein